MRILVATVLFAFFGPASAHAAPLAALGAALVGAAGSLGGIFSVGGGLLAKLLVTGISIGAQVLLAPKQKTPEPQDLKTTKKSEEGPGYIVFGRGEVEGQIAFGNTAGYYLYRLILHAFGPLDAVEEYFYDGRSVVVEANGKVSSPPFARAGNESYLTLKTKAGDGGELAWPELMSAFPGLWTSEHRVRGIVQTLLVAYNPGTADEKFGVLYTGGLKSVKIRGRFGKFYDPRDETTHWSMNSALICLHYLRELPFVSDDQIDFDDIADVADACDALIGTKDGGTAPRSQLSGGGEALVTVDFIEELLESAGLEHRITADGKRTFALLEDNPSSELTFEADHLLELTLRKGPEGAKRPNFCRVKYFSAERGYSVAEVDLDDAPWARISSEIALYGEQEKTFELKFCPDVSQAQRIARRLFYLERAVSGVARMSFVGMAAWRRRTVIFKIPDFGADGSTISSKSIIDPVSVDDEEGVCEIPFKVIPDELKIAWDPDTDEVDPPPELVDLEYDSDVPTPSVPDEAIAVEASPGVWRVELRYTPPAEADTTEANYRTYTGGLPDAWSGMTEVNSTLSILDGDYRGQQMDFRYRVFDEDGEGSYFSPILEIASLAEE